MAKLESLGADPLCNIVAFALGADIVALLATGRHVRATLAGSVARKHFQALSIARWGEGCRCHYAIAKATKTLEEDGEIIRSGSTNDVQNSAGTIEKTFKNVSSSNSSSSSSSSSGKEKCTEEGDDWLAFFLRRVGHRAMRPSPLDLLQEHYSEDAYRLLSCCILCSRTSGGDTVKNAVAAFFKACPTPTSVLSADQEELRETLLPLGLNREVIMKRFAEGFLASPWHDPSELHGCGRFASDSWQIFCLGSYRPGDQVVAAAAATAVAADGSGCAKKKKTRCAGRRGSLDRNLAAFCRFAERAAAKGEGAAAAGRDESSDMGMGRAEARKAAATVTLGGKRMKRTMSMAPERRRWLESDKSVARRPSVKRAIGSRRSASSVSDGALSQTRLTKVGGGIARGIVGEPANTRKERALRRSSRER